MALLTASMTFVALGIAQQSGAKTDQYHQFFHNKLKSFRGVSVDTLTSSLSSEYQRIKQLKKPLDTDVLALCAHRLAFRFYHWRYYKGPGYQEVPGVMAGWINDLKPSAERDILIELFIENSPAPNSRRIDPSLASKYYPIAFAAALGWNIKCKSEKDLANFKAARVALKDSGLSKIHEGFFEASYELECYFVRKDFDALERSIKVGKATAKLTKDVNQIKAVDKWYAQFEPQLKKHKGG
ncbi:MAG: hypothetical protein QE269_02555 [Fimbriimonas sp.]|nr:hypothetical protein [Fimbriimonas sp.]